MIEKQVKEFMTVSGQNISNTPHVPHEKLKKFRESLIQEELNEVIESDNIVDLADALGDMCFVLEGYFLTSGLHIYKDRILKDALNQLYDELNRLESNSPLNQKAIDNINNQIHEKTIQK